jgi:PKHD-type hydroxylase
MRFHLPNVLSANDIAECRRLLNDSAWEDGKITAGSQAAQAKNNYQLDEEAAQASTLRAIVLNALSQNALFFSAALPKRIYPPLFNCYTGEKNSFANHVDNAIRTHPKSAASLRTDLSFTLFLSNPDEYEGGELIMEDGAASERYKLPAGDLLLYPSYHLHRVEPVTAGKRLACFSWIESMVRDSHQRDVLHDLDLSIMQLREQLGDNEQTVRLTHCYHNLMRLWSTP